MIVLKHGSALITKSCPKCGCEFAFDFHDIGEEWELGDTEDQDKGTAYVCCPECGNKIIWPIRTELWGKGVHYS